MPLNPITCHRVRIVIGCKEWMMQCTHCLPWVFNPYISHVWPHPSVSPRQLLGWRPACCWVPRSLCLGKWNWSWRASVHPGTLWRRYQASCLVLSSFAGATPPVIFLFSRMDFEFWCIWSDFWISQDLHTSSKVEAENLNSLRRLGVSLSLMWNDCEAGNPGWQWWLHNVRCSWIFLFLLQCL